MNLGGLTKPVSDLSQKTAKAQKVKSVKLKIKFSQPIKGNENNK